MDYISDESRQGFQSVDSRGTEADRAGVGVVFPNRRHLSDLEAKGRSLDQHLCVEDKIVAVLEERNRLEETTRVGAIAGVVLGEVQTQDAVFRRGQEPVAQPLPPGHASLRRVEPQPS